GTIRRSLPATGEGVADARDYQRRGPLALAAGHPRPQKPPARPPSRPRRDHALSPPRLAGLRAVAVQLVGAGLGIRRALPLRDARHQHRLPPAADAPRLRLPALVGARPVRPGGVLLAGLADELGRHPPHAPPAPR